MLSILDYAYQSLVTLSDHLECFEKVLAQSQAQFIVQMSFVAAEAVDVSTLECHDIVNDCEQSVLLDLSVCRLEWGLVKPDLQLVDWRSKGHKVRFTMYLPFGISLLLGIISLSLFLKFSLLFGSFLFLS